MIWQDYSIRLHEVAHCQTPAGSLVEQIIGVNKLNKSVYEKSAHPRKKGLSALDAKYKCVHQRIACRLVLSSVGLGKGGGYDGYIFGCTGRRGPLLRQVLRRNLRGVS
ncbi:hypothetical protein J437_LFUL013052 [Ladona fulva]|uniref:Uncharacterized protein n=1 Tax=Ladona fulva TaxID=123851 RepID=A0A8K0KGX9_LADFU|nr:hypothetical protein J437_LFUL013052 [Ladona fulva]